MNEALYQQIEEEILRERDAMVRDTIRFINIKSVVEPSIPGAPFGEGPKKMLDTVREMGSELGFVVKDYGSGFLSLALKEGPIDLGIWCHGDVVPEGKDWIHDPYNAIVYEDCIIGRGATDNKGQLSAILHLLLIFKRLSVRLDYNIGLFVGSAEEVGQFDMIGLPGSEEAPGFLNVAQPPKLSLVPDGGFPVPYCGMGGARTLLTSEKPLTSVMIEGGHEDDPGVVTATFTDGIHEPISETESMTHSTTVSTDNCFTRLFSKLLSLPYVTDADKNTISYMKEVAESGHGEVFGLDICDPDLGHTVVRFLEVTMIDGCPQCFVRYRYPFGTSEEDIIAHMNEHARPHGFTATLKQKNGVHPFFHGKDHPMIQLLTETADEIIGDHKQPFAEIGGTYAHWLPNAFVFGMAGCKKPEGYPEGRGSAHGRDELVSIDRLLRGMKIYARLLLKLTKEDFE